MYQSMSALSHSGNTITSRSLGIECLLPSMELSGELSISSVCINSSSLVQLSNRTCHKSIQTSHSCGTMLDGSSLAFPSSQHVGRWSSLVSNHKRFHHRCFSRPGVQGSPSAALNSLAAHRCVAKIRILFFSLSHSGRVDSRINYNSLPAVLGKMGRLMCSKGYTKQCHFCP